MGDEDSTISPSPREVADYVAAMAGELSSLCEGARLDGLATIFYAARLEARRIQNRLGPSAASHADVA